MLSQGGYNADVVGALNFQRLAQLTADEIAVELAVCSYYTDPQCDVGCCKAELNFFSCCKQLAPDGEVSPELCNCNDGCRHLEQIGSVRTRRQLVVEVQGDGGTTRRIRSERDEETAADENDISFKVHVDANDPDEFAWVRSHAEDVRERMDQGGGVAREWDPLFRAFFEHAHGIDTVCQEEEDFMECVKTAKTECGRDLIRAHSIYHDHGVWEEHAVPESCLR
jgi:hypothetical protein